MTVTVALIPVIADDAQRCRATSLLCLPVLRP